MQGTRYWVHVCTNSGWHQNNSFKNTVHNISQCYWVLGTAWCAQGTTVITQSCEHASLTTPTKHRAEVESEHEIVTRRDCDLVCLRGIQYCYNTSHAPLTHQTRITSTISTSRIECNAHTQVSTVDVHNRYCQGLLVEQSMVGGWLLAV